MTAIAARTADTASPTVTRHRVAVNGHHSIVWVDVWTTPAIGRSLSVAGNRLAERLAARVLGVSPSSLRVAPLAPSGRPVVLVAGAAGDCGISMTHQRCRSGDPSTDGEGLVAVAACRSARVGIDLVVPGDVSADAIAHFLGSDLPGGDAGQAVHLWAAKEAAFKASAIDEVFRPRRIAIEPSAGGGFRWRVDGRYRTVHGAGSFLAEDGAVLAVAVADRIPSMSPGASPRP